MMMPTAYDDDDNGDDDGGGAFKGDQGGDAIFSKKCKKRTNGESFVNPTATSVRHKYNADDDAGDRSEEASEMI